MKRFVTVLVAATLVFAACGDDGDEVGSGPPDVGEPAATFAGTVTDVTPFVPITEDCTPPEDLDPDGSVSSDDPPVCTDPDTAPLGSILVEAEPGTEGTDKIVFTITQDTVVTVSGEAAAFTDIRVGSGVTVGFDGQVAESYPGQATAETVDVRA